MNSSGIKRGLAATAISALAVTGLPALASTANAAVGDNFTVTYTGPALNGGDEGALVIIRAEDGEITGPLLATSTSSTTAGSEDNGDQNVEVLSQSAPVNDPANNAYEFIEVRVAVTTSDTGDTATFRLFEDDNAPGTPNVLDANEARQTVSISTAGELAEIAVTPANQSTPQGIESGEYTVTLLDAAGRTTQLVAGDTVTVSEEAPVDITETGEDTAIDDEVFTSDELVRGTSAFTANPNGATVGTYDIELTNAADPTIEDTATLTVTQSAVLTAGEVDIVTDADSWDGFGGGNFGPPSTFVRVDQDSIRIDIDAGDSDANSTVRLNLTGTGITFGGDATTSVTTVLDGAGNGSLTITPDAGTVQVGDTIDIGGAFTERLEFQRATVTDVVPEANPYFSAVDGTVDVTFTVVDQFGEPVTEGFLEAARDDENAAADATPQRKAVGDDGTVTFTFTDTQADNGDTENVDVEYFADEFSAVADYTEGNATTIKYTTDGMGSNYVISLDGASTEGADYDASDVTVVPLADTVADDDGGDNESATITLASGEPNSQVTFSVDNGARILVGAEDELHEGSDSVTASLDGAGLLTDTYRIIGTNSGVVTLTASSANRTETAQFTVADQDDATTARNVSVSGPAEVEAGDEQIQYAALITDAFGNPVEGVSIANLNIQVTGPAEFQDSDAVSNADGVLNLNVSVDDDAEDGEIVTIRVEGMGHQFGADEDQLTATSPDGAAEDLPASSNVGTASTEVTGERIPAALALKGGDNGAADDSLFANAIKETAGAEVTLSRKKADGTWKKIRTGVMNAKGNFRFKNVNDKNGNKVTKYKAVVKATDDTLRGVGKKRVR